jgi:hypothetical protein
MLILPPSLVLISRLAIIFGCEFEEELEDNLVTSEVRPESPSEELV